mgnify:CR=1 FL=1
MPALIPAAAAYAAGSAAAAAGWSAFAVAVLQIAVAAAVSQFTNRFKNDGGGFRAEQRGTQVVLRSAVEPQRIIYGEAVVSGPLVYSRVSRDSARAVERHRVPPASPYTVQIAFGAEYQATLEAGPVSIVSLSIGDFENVTPLTAVGGAPGADEYNVSATGVYTFHA